MHLASLRKYILNWLSLPFSKKVEFHFLYFDRHLYGTFKSTSSDFPYWFIRGFIQSSRDWILILSCELRKRVKMRWNMITCFFTPKNLACFFFIRRKLETPCYFPRFSAIFLQTRPLLALDGYFTHQRPGKVAHPFDYLILMHYFCFFL